MSAYCSYNDEFVYRFPATRGLQYKPFFQATIPLRVLVKMLRVDDKGSTLERSQRLVSPTRVRAFAKYLIKAKQTKGFFIIPSLNGVINVDPKGKKPQFYSVSDVVKGLKSSVAHENIGELLVSIDSTISLFDGQHRSCGGAEALSEIARKPKLYEDLDLNSISIPIMLFTELTLEECQMGFSDINNNLSKPPAAISIAYAKRDPLSMLACSLGSTLTCFNGLVDFEKNTVSTKSPYYFSIKTIKDATQTFLGLSKGADTEDHHQELAAHYWNKVSRSTGWAALGFAPTDAGLHRAQYINTYAVFINALGLFGYVARNHFGSLDNVPFEQLEALDYKQGSETFKDRAFDSKTGNMTPTAVGVKLTAIALLKAIDCPLPDNLLALETKHFS